MSEEKEYEEEGRSQSKSMTVRIAEDDLQDFREFVPYFKNQSELFSTMLKSFKLSNGIEGAKLQRDLQEYLNHSGAMSNLLSNIVNRSLAMESKFKAEAERKCGNQRAEIERLQGIIKEHEELLTVRITAAVTTEQGKAMAQAEKLQASINELQAQNNEYKEQVLKSTKERLEALEAAKQNEEAAKQNDDLKKQLLDMKNNYETTLEAEANKRHVIIESLEADKTKLQAAIDNLHKETTNLLAEQEERLLARSEFEKQQCLLVASQRYTEEIDNVRQKAYEQVNKLLERLNRESVKA